MKVSDILLNYLLKHKTLPLPGLGVFNLTGSYAISEEDKKVILPAGAVEFILDPHTAEDPELISAIAAETVKFKPLASSDLESLILQGKQLMNISKPFLIEGIGTLQKNHRNEIEYIPLVDEINRHDTDLRLEEPGEAIRFDDNYLRPTARKGNNNKSRSITFALMMLAGIIILGLVGYYFYQQSRDRTVILEQPVTEDSSVNNFSTLPVPAPDSSKISLPADSATKAIVPLTIDSASFLVVVERAKKERALKRYADLREWGHKVIMSTQDSVDFKISFPIKAPLSDTARYRDSLSSFFGKKVWIEIK